MEPNALYDKNALMALVREKALQFGEFTLVSGKQASYYLDGKQITLDAAGARILGEGILDLLADVGDGGIIHLHRIHFPIETEGRNQADQGQNQSEYT